MTQPTASRVGFLDELRDIVSTIGVPHHEPPAVILRRRIGVTVVLVIGGALLGYSMTRRPGDESFYWLTLALAAVWALMDAKAARCSGALPTFPCVARDQYSSATAAH